MSENTSPAAPPPFSAAVASEGQRPGAVLLAAMTADELKKLYWRSLGITGIGCLWILAAILQLIGFIAAVSNTDDKGAQIAAMVIPIIFIIFFLAAYGSFKRTTFGRIVNILLFVGLLLGIPIGTLIGVVGLIVYIPAKPLFGEGKIPHKELVLEWQKRSKGKG